MTPHDAPQLIWQSYGSPISRVAYDRGDPTRDVPHWWDVKSLEGWVGSGEQMGRFDR